jgi:S1-C subfamily serine protease
MKPDQQGVLVSAVEPGGAGEELGATAGNIVLRAGDRAVNTPAELADAYAAAQHAGVEFIPLLIQFTDGTIGWRAVPLFDYR